jgi:hypothetical protein
MPWACSFCYCIARLKFESIFWCLEYVSLLLHCYIEGSHICMTLSTPYFDIFSGALICQVISSAMSNVFVADVLVLIKKQFNIRFLYFKFEILFLYNARSDVHQGLLNYKFTLCVWRLVTAIVYNFLLLLIALIGFNILHGISFHWLVAPRISKDKLKIFLMIYCQVNAYSYIKQCSSYCSCWLAAK